MGQFQKANTAEDKPAQLNQSSLNVERHKTAVTRYKLSKPVKSILEYQLLKPWMTVFDYGCGLGADVAGLQALGFQASGWDPKVLTFF